MTKTQRTLTLDPDVAERFDLDGSAFSTTVNRILRAEMDRIDARRALADFLGDIERDHGPADPERVAHFRALLRSDPQDLTTLAAHNPCATVLPL